MPADLRVAIADFNHPHDVEQLRNLEAAIVRLAGTPLDPEDVRSVFNLFERFPEDDGYGTFWSLLHAVEATDGYESELLSSVFRSPGEYNVMMVGRLLNSGVDTVSGHRLRPLLLDIAKIANLSEKAASKARAFTSQQAPSEA